MQSIQNEIPVKRILFANFPADGHFNPLTGLAVDLISKGYEVRWYSSKSYGPKLKQLNIHHYPFKKAVDVSDGNFDKVFPEREKIKSQVSKLKFDIINAFILRAPEYFDDIKEIYEKFPFDLMIADCAFTGIPFVKDILSIPVISIGVFPLTESSVDLPPNGLGIEPSKSYPGKIKQALLRTIAKHLIFREPNRVLHLMMDKYKIRHNKETIFDMLLKKSDYLLQSGTPGFEYARTDMSNHIRFAGPVLPYRAFKKTVPWFDERLNRYKKIILVTQGTVEKDIKKLLIPTLEAYKNSDSLIIVTTGGSKTQELRSMYPGDNIIIEDFISFSDVMPYANVYITNGGYGGVMLSIQNNLPMVVAGVHEGKNEICARVNYFKLGINLKTELPKPEQIRSAVEKILGDKTYRENVVQLANEFEQYNPDQICLEAVRELVN